ncbi:unnamed protein product, partial [Symbiodinium microadriaticum]
SEVTSVAWRSVRFLSNEAQLNYGLSRLTWKSSVLISARSLSCFRYFLAQMAPKLFRGDARCARAQSLVCLGKKLPKIACAAAFILLACSVSLALGPEPAFDREPGMTCAICKGRPLLGLRSFSGLLAGLSIVMLLLKYRVIPKIIPPDQFESGFSLGKYYGFAAQVLYHCALVACFLAVAWNRSPGLYHMATLAEPAYCTLGHPSLILQRGVIHSLAGRLGHALGKAVPLLVHHTISCACTHALMYGLPDSIFGILLQLDFHASSAVCLCIANALLTPRLNLTARQRLSMQTVAMGIWALTRVCLVLVLGFFLLAEAAHLAERAVRAVVIVELSLAAMGSFAFVIIKTPLLTSGLQEALREYRECLYTEGVVAVCDGLEAGWASTPALRRAAQDILRSAIQFATGRDLLSDKLSRGQDHGLLVSARNSIESMPAQYRDFCRAVQTTFANDASAQRQLRAETARMLRKHATSMSEDLLVDDLKSGTDMIRYEIVQVLNLLTPEEALRKKSCGNASVGIVCSRFAADHAVADQQEELVAEFAEKVHVMDACLQELGMRRVANGADFTQAQFLKETYDVSFDGGEARENLKKVPHGKSRRADAKAQEWLQEERQKGLKGPVAAGGDGFATHAGFVTAGRGQRMHCFESCCAIVARVCTRYRPERRFGSSDGTSDSFGRLHTWSLPSLRRAGSGSLAQFQDYIGHFPNNRTTGDKMFANQSLKLVGRMHTLFSTRLQTSRSTTCSESGAAGQCGNENACLSLQLDGNLVLFFINTDTLICSSKTPELRDGRILAAMEMSGNLSRYRGVHFYQTAGSSGQMRLLRTNAAIGGDAPLDGNCFTDRRIGENWAEERAEKRWRQKFEDSLPNFDFRALFSLRP